MNVFSIGKLKYVKTRSGCENFELLKLIAALKKLKRKLSIINSTSFSSSTKIMVILNFLVHGSN